MRIVVDLGGVQASGPGDPDARAALALLRALARQAQAHELWLALDGRHADSIEPLRAACTGLIAQERIRVYDLPGTVPGSAWRQQASALLRAAFLADLEPDLVHMPCPLAAMQTPPAASGAYSTCITCEAALLALLHAVPATDRQHRMASWLAGADLLLARDAAARLALIKALGVPAHRVIDLAASACAEHGDWDESARRALAGFASLPAREPQSAAPPTRRLRLAFVSPLPPAATGIADYSAELLPALSRHYEIEVVSDAQETSDPWISAHCPLRSLAWFEAHAERYDRVLYQMGNSWFHAPMPALLARHPGVVVLHDFFLSGLLGWSAIEAGVPEALLADVYTSHGYVAQASGLEVNRTHLAWTYPANLPVLTNATGVIVHSQSAVALAQHWYGLPPRHFRVVPMPYAMPATDRAAARRALGLAPDDFLVCCFGRIGAHKLDDRLLDAWLAGPLRDDPHCRLVFLGGGLEEDYGTALRERAAAAGADGRISLTGHAGAANYALHLAGTDLAVQLRARDRGETSRSVLDCLAYGVATIVNAHGSLRELPNQVALKLPDAFSDAELAAALQALRADAPQRARLAAAGAAYVRARHHPEQTAQYYREAIEAFHHDSPMARRARLLDALAALEESGPGTREAHHPPHATPAVRAEAADLLATAACIHANRAPAGPRQLLVDVSARVFSPDRSGIPRVVRSIMMQWLRDPPPGYRVEPVRAVDGGYHYARQYTLGQLGQPAHLLADAPVDVAPGDIFVGLDYYTGAFPEVAPLVQGWRDRGVRVHYVIYDLLPLLMPDYFVPELPLDHRRWLDQIANCADGLVCISRAVADDVHAWLQTHPPARVRPLAIDWFHLGADVEASLPTRGLPADAAATLAALRGRPSFLIVGTVEPRKGCAQALAAFEGLWARDEGFEANLVLVGRQGWYMEELSERLRGHAEAGKRLFWLENVSDEYLEQVYPACTALLAPSEGEGFGLPLVEAARRGLPIIARDIPVFREVAGAHASYFSGMTASDLAQAIREWLALHARGAAPDSTGMPWLTWEQSARQISDVVVARTRAYRQWEPDGVALPWDKGNHAPPCAPDDSAPGLPINAD